MDALSISIVRLTLHTGRGIVWVLAAFGALSFDSYWLFDAAGKLGFSANAKPQTGGSIMLATQPLLLSKFFIREKNPVQALLAVERGRRCVASRA